MISLKIIDIGDLKSIKNILNLDFLRWNRKITLKWRSFNWSVYMVIDQFISLKILIWYKPNISQGDLLSQRHTV